MLPVGTWSSKYQNTILKFTQDGKLYATSIELGFFDLPIETTADADALTFALFDQPCTLIPKNDNTYLLKLSDTEANFHQMDVPLSINKARSFNPNFIPASNREAFIGKWSSPVPYGECILNVYPEGENQVRFTITFPIFRNFNFAPHSYWLDEEILIWQINDAYNLGRCEVTLRDGKLTGTYTQMGHGGFDPVVFTKVSDTPSEDRDNSPIPLPDKSRLEILREFANYEKPVVTEYALGEPLPEEVLALGFEDAVAGKSGEELAYACLDFVCDHWHHNGSSGMPRGRFLLDVMKFADEHDHAVNCRGLSVMLSILLRHVGLKAQHVTCLPYEYPFSDCHVVVDCLLPDGKRVMLDPTHRLHFTDEAGEPVSLPALRQHLIDGTPLTPNATADYNGGEFYYENYREYMSKNTFRFSRGTCNKDGIDENPTVELCPVGYPIEKTEPSPTSIILHNPLFFWGE